MVLKLLSKKHIQKLLLQSNQSIQDGAREVQKLRSIQHSAEGKDTTICKLIETKKSLQGGEVPKELAFAIIWKLSPQLSSSEGALVCCFQRIELVKLPALFNLSSNLTFWNGHTTLTSEIERQTNDQMLMNIVNHLQRTTNTLVATELIVVPNEHPLKKIKKLCS